VTFDLGRARCDVLHVWIFGYGSLIWKTDFDWVDRRVGHVRGWKRRFWQGSTDHRGVPGSPGRVVTLLPDPNARCFGVAYLLEPSGVEATLDALDHREKGGYERRVLRVYDAAGAQVEAVTYVATPDNPDYLGEAGADEMADQILRSRGPSGANVEYLLELAAALQELGAEDAHIFELERALLRRMRT